MAEAPLGTVPTAKWVQQGVVSFVTEPVLSVQMLTNSLAVILTDSYALVAEKGRLGGVKTHRANYPPSFRIQGSRCPHCDKPITEPIGKVARLATEGQPRKAKKKR